MTDDAHHFPTELVELLVETIPRLVRSKRSVVDFFDNCGADAGVTGQLWRQVDINEAPAKYPMARQMLNDLNRRGDAGIGVRRRLLQRVIEWEDFSGSYENDRLKAIGLVSQVRSAVSQKDSFTRMTEERDREHQKHVNASRAAAQAASEAREHRADIRRRLVDLHREPNAAARGKEVENVLNDLFGLDGVAVREQFTINGESGVEEQIDGLISFLDGLYLVEVKWWKEKLGPGDIAQHMVRLMTRADTRGLFISASGYTSAAVNSCTRALATRTLVLAELGEIVMLLESETTIRDWLTQKAAAATVDRTPLVRYGVDYR